MTTRLSIRICIFTTFLYCAFLSPDITNAQGTVTVVAYLPDGPITVSGIPISDTCKSNVRLAMLNANHINPKFTFQTSYYYPLGDYVTEIDGRYGSGMYWTMYVNQQPASCGINTQILNPGDVVSWYLVSTSDKKHNSKSFQAKLFALRRKKEVKKSE